MLGTNPLYEGSHDVIPVYLVHLSRYNNAVTDLRYAVKSCDRARLLAQAQAANAAYLRTMTEPCTRCRGRMVVRYAGCLYPCEECCTIEDDKGE